MINETRAAEHGGEIIDDAEAHVFSALRYKTGRYF